MLRNALKIDRQINVMNCKIAVLAGVGIDWEGSACRVETPYGSVPAKIVDLNGWEVIFILRHGECHLPPHRVNYRANLCAIRKLGKERVISINTVGTMSWHALGSFFIPYDFVEFTKARPNTFFDERAVHVDMKSPYCPELRSALLDATRSSGFDPGEGVYVCAEGPHLESPAQIRMMRNFGDVVGMTGYPEVVLARELKLCYASFCIVANLASGMDRDAFSLSKLVSTANQMKQNVFQIVARAISKIPEERSCYCKDALLEAKL